MYYAMYCRLHVRVWESDITVIRAARRKIADQHRTARAMRAERHAFYREMLAQHYKARDLARQFRL